MKKKLPYVAAALVVTVAFGVLYVAVQQALRRSANEPQSSMASDVAAALENGAQPNDLTKNQVDVPTSMAPFIIIYDKHGRVVSGSGYIDGQVPQVPVGVLHAATRSNPHAVTWQPEKKVRIASVTYATRDYYVLGGRSLYVVEQWVRSFTQWMAGVWVLLLLLIAAVYAVANRGEKRVGTKEA